MKSAFAQSDVRDAFAEALQTGRPAAADAERGYAAQYASEAAAADAALRSTKRESATLLEEVGVLVDAAAASRGEIARAAEEAAAEAEALRAELAAAAALGSPAGGGDDPGAAGPSPAGAGAGSSAPPEAESAVRAEAEAAEARRLEARLADARDALASADAARAEDDDACARLRAELGRAEALAASISTCAAGTSAHAAADAAAFESAAAGVREGIEWVTAMTELLSDVSGARVVSLERLEAGSEAASAAGVGARGGARVSLEMATLVAPPRAGGGGADGGDDAVPGLVGSSTVEPAERRRTLVLVVEGGTGAPALATLAEADGAGSSPDVDGSADAAVSAGLAEAVSVARRVGLGADFVVAEARRLLGGGGEGGREETDRVLSARPPRDRTRASPAPPAAPPPIRLPSPPLRLGLAHRLVPFHLGPDVVADVGLVEGPWGGGGRTEAGSRWDGRRGTEDGDKRTGGRPSKRTYTSRSRPRRSRSGRSPAPPARAPGRAGSTGRDAPAPPPPCTASADRTATACSADRTPRARPWGRRRSSSSPERAAGERCSLSPAGW